MKTIRILTLLGVGITLLAMGYVYITNPVDNLFDFDEVHFTKVVIMIALSGAIGAMSGIPIGVLIVYMMIPEEVEEGLDRKIIEFADTIRKPFTNNSD